LLPVPSVAGGAMGKMWWRLARLYVGRGLRVTLISRRWPGWPGDETVDDIHLLRVAGHRKRFGTISRALRDAMVRKTLGYRAGEAIWALDEPIVAGQHLADFESQLHASRP
jgi:hypothetical protein